MSPNAVRVATLALLAAATLARAQITVDGTLSPAGALTGPDYRITADLGRQVGGNLFHSFGSFNVNTGESATFSGPAATANVLARVTGGAASNVNGLLRTQGMPEANLFLVNPGGVVFGPNARLDVGGAFAVTTADAIELADGGRFDAAHPPASVLTTAPPGAFGFLGPTPAAIRAEGGTLEVGRGRRLSVIGGNVELRGGTLRAPVGRVDLVSVAGAGNVRLEALDSAGRPAERLGPITLRDGARVDADGASGGRVVIRGGQLTIDHADVTARTLGGDPGRGIDVGLTGDLRLTHGQINADVMGAGDGGDVRIEAGAIELRDLGSINAQTSGTGRGGDVHIQAGRLSARAAQPSGIRTVELPIVRPSDPFAPLPDEELAAVVSPGIFTDSLGPGAAGDVAVAAGRLELTDTGVISASAFGSGDGGDITITADSIFVSRGRTDFATGIFASALQGASGDAGDLVITTGTLEIVDGGLIGANTFGRGAGGNLTLTADTILLSAEGTERATGIGADTGREASGNAGNLMIDTDQFTILGGASIQAITAGQGAAGTIYVDAGEIRIDGQGEAGGINAFTVGPGNGGNVVVHAGEIELRDLGGINAVTLGTGKGGSIEVTADRIFAAADQPLSEPVLSLPIPRPDGSIETVSLVAGPGIFANTFFGGGDAGSIDIAAGRIELASTGNITAATFGPGRGGDITIDAGAIHITRGESQSVTGIFVSTLPQGETGGAAGTLDITTASLTLVSGGLIGAPSTGDGMGGSVTIRADNILFSAQGSRRATGIGVQAFGEGNGGSLFIATDRLTLRDDALIVASSVRSGGGNIEIEARDLVTLIGSAITTDVESGAEDAGNIRIAEPAALTLIRGSRIDADAAQGRGGAVSIATGTLIADRPREEIITATSERGVEFAGRISIDSPEVDVDSALQVLPETFLDVAAVLPAPCAQRLASEGIGLMIRRYEALPDSPYALRTHLPATPAADVAWPAWPKIDCDD